MAVISCRSGRAPSLSTSFLLVGALLTAAFVTIALLAPAFEAWGWLRDPTASLSNPVREPPGAEYWFGTNRQGYDIFARTLFGMRAALQVVVAATAFSLTVGVPLGLIGGYLGGKVDRVLLFFMDTIYTLPPLLLSITLAFAIGQGIINAAAAIGIAYIPQYYRVVRNHTASLKSELFVEAAQASGATPARIISRHLFANVMQNIPVLFTLNAADAIFVLGGLGFLGLGLPPEVPEWGYALRQALGALPTGIWWPAFFPGMAMTLTVVGLSLLGEGLSEVFHPRWRNVR